MNPKSRLTVNLSEEEYTALEELAERSRVSKAWLGRHAIAALLKQASNDAQASVRIGEQELVVVAAPGAPGHFQWDVALSQNYPHNSVRVVNNVEDVLTQAGFLKRQTVTDQVGGVHT